MRTITKEGKNYTVSDEGVITEASALDETVYIAPKKEVYVVGDRVEVADRPGTIESIVSSIYGPAAGVQFDNGHKGEFFLEVLTRSEVEEPAFATPVDELMSEFANYESFYTAGLEDIRKKASKARELNLRARAMIGGVSTEDKISLDKIVVTTRVDIESLKDDERSLEVAQSGYLEDLPRYEIQGGDTNGHNHVEEDASWLVDAAADQEEELAAINWDGFLASEAIDLVNRVSEYVLADEGMTDDTVTDYFVNLAHGLEGSTYGVRLAQFKGFVKSSRSERLEKISSMEKTAALDDDVSFESLFI